MSSPLTLPPNYATNPLIEISWNGFLREQCQIKGAKEKHKDCKVILSLIYDPTVRRLIPIWSSPK